VTEEKDDLDRSLNAKIDSLQKEVEALKRARSDLAADLNSVYYVAASKDTLEDRDIIKGSFLGLFGMSIKDVEYSDFDRSMDLGQSQVIELQASDVGVSRIKDAHLLPKHLKENEDYRVEVAGDGQTTRIHILDEDVFRLARVVVHVDD
jgi:hypothetical protein